MFVVERIKIVECTSRIRKSDQGASVTVKWQELKPGDRYEVKFTWELEDGVSSAVTRAGIQGERHTETTLQHGISYKVTVFVMDSPGSESEAMSVETPEGIMCKNYGITFAIILMGTCIILSYHLSSLLVETYLQ